MKLKITAAMLICLLAVGCSAPEDEKKPLPGTEEPVKVTDTVTDTLFIGYDRQELFTWETAPSYMVNDKGEKILEMNGNHKSIFEVDGKQYAMERTIENAVQNEYGWYDYEYKFIAYNDKGEKVGEMKNINNARHIKDGRFSVYNNKLNTYKIVNIFTGEEEETGFIDIIFANDEAIGLMYMDDEYNFKGLSDPDGENYREFTLYDGMYTVTTDHNTFLVAQLNLEESKKINSSASEYSGRLQHLLNFEGEKVVDVNFDRISSQSDHILGYTTSGETYILDGKDGGIIAIVPFEVVRYYEGSGVLVKHEKDLSSKSGNKFSLVDMDMNVISDGWEGFSDMYRGGNDEYFTFYKYKEGESYDTDIYIINIKGEVTFGPFSEQDEWIMAMCKNHIITEGYDREKHTQTYNVYDYYGNRVDLGKDYVSFQRQYNYDGTPDYFIAAYENPVSAGHIFDIYDAELNLLYSGFNYIYPYGNTGRFASVAKGFDIGIFDIETGQWIYKEAAFNGLDD